MPDLKYQTVRIRNLPGKTETADVQNFLLDKNIISSIAQANIGPICDQAESLLKQTTVSLLVQQEKYNQVLTLPEARRRFTCKAGFGNDPGRSSVIDIDNHFLELTTIHSSNNTLTGKPDIE